MPGVICGFEACRRSIIGDELAVRIELHRVDGAEVPFGPGMEAGLLEAGAEFPLTGVFHSKCWYSRLKRARLLAARAADPTGHHAETDWRYQETAFAEDFRGDVQRRDYRGAGETPE